MNEEIRFNDPLEEPYGCFSNYFRKYFTAKGWVWMSVEHYIQAMKFEGTEHEEIIRNLPSPEAAAEYGRRTDLPLRKDWEIVKEQIVMEGIHYKFASSVGLYEKLMETGDHRIIYDNPNPYWGCGEDGNGRNELGKILELVRTGFLMDLRDEADFPFEE